MAVTTTPRPVEARAGRTAPRWALAVADANWFTTEHLFAELDRPGVSTLLLKCHDYRNAWRRGLFPWSGRGRGPTARGPALWERELVLPTGWMKTFPRLGMRPIGRSIARWRRRHVPDGRLGLVMTYPHYLYLRDLVRPDRVVYFNLDDYAQYWPRRADRVHGLERQAVREADLTVCTARWRCDELRAAVPEAAGKIRHLPHGAPEAALGRGPAIVPDAPPADVAHLPRPLLGYVGSLEDRIDWPLLVALAAALPHASIVLIGRVAEGRGGAWQAECRRCLARPNVHRLGWRPQAELPAYNRAFDCCLIPYRADHPFNRACCPTKIMDYMATGRPVVATDLPECRLYSDFFRIAATRPQFLDAVRDVLACGPDDGLAVARHAFARANTCRLLADRLLDWLPG